MVRFSSSGKSTRSSCAGLGRRTPRMPGISSRASLASRMELRADVHGQGVPLKWCRRARPGSGRASGGSAKRDTWAQPWSLGIRVCEQSTHGTDAPGTSVSCGMGRNMPTCSPIKMGTAVYGAGTRCRWRLLSVARMTAVMETATEETMVPLAATPTPAGPSVGHEPGRHKVQGPIGQEATQKGVRPLLVAARAGVIGRGAILRAQS